MYWRHQQMNMLAERVDHVIGVDPDRDRITLAVVHATTTGVMARAVFNANPSGYQSALAWAGEHTSTERRVWSIEGAGSYGAGLAMSLCDEGEWVVGFDRPEGNAAKDGAKSDALDAVRAARELLGREVWGEPRARGPREAVRALLSCRDGAQHARVAAINELRSLVVTCDPVLREELRGLTLTRLVKHCVAFEPAGEAERVGTLTAMRCLARRVRALGAEARELEQELHTLIDDIAPQLLDEPGVGVITAAQVIVSWSHSGRCRSEAAFARLGGVAPIPATSGQEQTRHRLSRGGDRALNRALHLVIITRCRQHPETRAYITRRVAQGKTSREARRCLKRYLARHLYRILENPPKRVDMT
jgi:transposase